ncbi:restriction endonuclease subunit S [Gluconobacter kondonii]|uniref:restriction endonuclease subunit S n=1 Tax=Gluconobacter kondonii TaxID=941463 RepID=UPI001B8C55F2|nr:restriction endonuclease subunit S [Gluconobacter kondonii]MBS1057970.1 restriction endonuclease subunit S [Gluconobacter kondonii]
MSVLPTGWVDTEIGQIAQIETGNTPSKNDVSLYGREVCFYKPGDLDVGGVISTSNDMVSKAGAAAGRILPAESLLVTCIGNLGKSALIAEPAICNQQINAVLPSRAAEPHYLYYWSRTIKPWLEENSSATTVSIINKGRFSKAPIRIAPLPEQRRIVAKIDSLTGKSRRARDHLDHIPRLVEKYKQAILAAAFRGDLTREWRVKTGRTREWKTVCIGEVAVVRLGKMLDRQKNKGELTGYLRNINVRWRAFGLDDILEMKMTDSERTELNIQDGDLLVCEGGEPGRAAIWNSGHTNLSFQKALMRVRPSSSLLATWLLNFLHFQALSGDLSNHFTGTTIKHLPRNAMIGIKIPLAPIEEQAEIVRRIETAFRWIDRLAANATSARKLIDHLDQSVLAKAFKGELVPQDPADEPASALLERIRAERAAAPKAKRGRKKAA